MISTERVLEYSKLEPEADHGLSRDLSKGWPREGSIIARNASFTYHSTLPNVLKNVNFMIKPREKVSLKHQFFDVIILSIVFTRHCLKILDYNALLLII